MRFLVLIHDESHGQAGAPSDSMMQAMTEFRADTTHGRLIDDGGLMPSEEAIIVRTADGRSTLVDGPFAETKEVVGGFFIVESASRDDARIWSQGFAELHAQHWPGLRFTAEVRQVFDPMA